MTKQGRSPFKPRTTGAGQTEGAPARAAADAEVTAATRAARPQGTEGAGGPVIEPTDEMIVAFESASDDVGVTAGDTRAGLAAVLAIVEREYFIGPRGCCEPAPGEPMAYCELAEGHRGKHSATVEKAFDW